MKQSPIRIEIPFKTWVMNEAEKLGIKKHALHCRILRRRHPLPGIVKRGPSGRAISIILITDQIPKLT